MDRPLLVGATLALSASAQPPSAQLQPPEHADVEVVGSVVEPHQPAPTPER